MPSGAKKRKAAKKKKELQQAKHPDNSHGEEDLKHESDSEGGSPASQDHQNQFTQGEVENGEKHMDDRSIHKNKSNGVEVVERELKVEGESESQKLNVESCNGGLQRSSSSSSSSSSSVEKHVVADMNNTVIDNSPAVVLEKENDSLPDPQVTDRLVGAPSISDFKEVAISEDIVQATVSASDADNVTSSIVEPVVKEQRGEKLCDVDEKGAASDTVKENWEEKLGVVDKNTVSEVLVEAGLGKRNEADSAVSCEGSAVSNGNAVANTDAKASVTLENEDKVEPPHDASTIDVGVCADVVKDSPARESHDHQLTAVPSRPVQTTSWKGCCGLFELFAGSNR